jgi:hypothetical protein
MLGLRDSGFIRSLLSKKTTVAVVDGKRAIPPEIPTLLANGP